MSTPPETPPRRPTAAEERAERLAAELRANLQRRKRQTRGRDAAQIGGDECADDTPRGGDSQG
ncbi:MAG: hypothetical protein LWW93_07810 [Hyphomicrobiales bacterium]|nr:hypothetical protein [Hyphomicrobiales bacterium]